MPASPIVQGLLLFSLAACGYGLVKGGRAERIAALIILINFAIGAVGNPMLGGAGLVFRLVNDAVAAFGLMALAVIYGSLWLGIAMLLYGGQFTLHAYYFVAGRSVSDHFHAVVNNALFFAISTSLVAGTTLAWRRRIRAERGLTL